MKKKTSPFKPTGQVFDTLKKRFLGRVFYAKGWDFPGKGRTNSDLFYYLPLPDLPVLIRRYIKCGSEKQQFEFSTEYDRYFVIKELIPIHLMLMTHMTL